MSEYIHLIGAEQVQSAANAMRSAERIFIEAGVECLFMFEGA